jgi:hypothetical protein
MFNGVRPETNCQVVVPCTLYLTVAPVGVDVKLAVPVAFVSFPAVEQSALVEHWFVPAP